MKNIHLRRSKTLAALLAFLLGWSLFCLPVSAKSTEIFTVVPETHSITVTIGRGGAVIGGDGQVHTASYTAKVSHNGTLDLVLRPDSGYALASVTLDGQIQEIFAGRLELKSIAQDGNLKVSFQEAAGEPSEKTYTIVGTITENGVPVPELTLELHSEPKTCVTDTNGKFRFDKVEAGEHSLTALRNGKAVGYLQFKLEENSTDVSLARLPDGSFEIQLDQNVTTLKLDVALRQNDTMELVGAEAVSDQQAQTSYPPATGDAAGILYWLAAMSAAGMLLVLLTVFRKRRNAK